MTDLTNVISAIITLIVALITTFLIPYIKVKIDKEKLEKMESWVKIAVQAAEKIYKESGQGEKKKAYVMAYLKEKGYKVDIDTLNNLIESAVLELDKSLK